VTRPTTSVCRRGSRLRSAPDALRGRFSSAGPAGRVNSSPGAVLGGLAITALFGLVAGFGNVTNQAALMTVLDGRLRQ
jgi:hypothetical protein